MEYGGEVDHMLSMGNAKMHMKKELAINNGRK
jgi:hypothetical protein